MNRRNLLKLLAAGIVAHTVDIDKILWVPGRKKIFIPSNSLTISQVYEIELARIAPRIKDLFERDNMFYKLLSDGIKCTSSPKINVIIEPRNNLAQTSR